MWMHRLLDTADFVHHLLVNGQTTGGIDDDHVLVLGLGVLNGVLGNLNGVLVAFLAIHLHFHLLTQHLQLVDSGGTVHVAGHQQHLLALLAFQIISQFGRESGLTGTLKTSDQNDGGLTFQIDFRLFATHQLGQLVVDDLHHHLTRLHRGQNLLTQGLLFDLVGDFLGNLVADIGVEQRAADFLHGVGHVDFSDISLSFKDFERAF